MEGSYQNGGPAGDRDGAPSTAGAEAGPSSWYPTYHPPLPAQSQPIQPIPQSTSAQQLLPDLHLNIDSSNGSSIPFDSPLETPSAAPPPPGAGPSRILLRPTRKPPGNLTMGLNTSSSTDTRLRNGGRGVPRGPSGPHTKGAKVKLKFKVGPGGKGEGRGRMSSFLGEYDRELDENPEDTLAFEEQFILRVPERLAGGANGLREMVKGKGKGMDGVEFKFLDSRRAAFKMNGVTYASKLVDLPCIVESQKTHDSRHLFKVADISQMLIVEQPIKDESSITSAALKVDDYIWPHGLTPPLRHVRKRRFRKRISRRAIEVVEEQVEELLQKDQEAEGNTTFDLIEAHPDPDVPDSYYIDYDPDAQWHRGGTASEYGGSEMYDDPGSVAPSDWADGDPTQTPGQQSREEESGEDDLDEELAAALMEQMERGSDASGSDDGLSASEDDDDEDAEKSEEDDDESAEKKARIRQLTSEIKALEGAIEKKRAGFTGGNPIIQKRFDETIAGLHADIKTKMETRQGLVDELDQATAEKRERRRSTASAAKPSGAATPAAGVDVEMDGDADGEGEGEGDFEEVPTPAGAGAATPGMDSAPPTPADAEVSYDDGEDDLFGDSEVDEPSAGVEQDEGADASAIQLLDDQAEGEGDGDITMLDGGDEMAAMLQAELADLPSSPPPPDFAGLESPQELNEREQADVNAALDDMRNLGSSPAPDLGGFGFGVEGGVGMRRLVVEDDEEDSSDDSDDD